MNELLPAVDRALENLVETFFESDPELLEVLAGKDPIHKEEFRGILLRAIEAYSRFYKFKPMQPEDKLLTAEDVANRYGLTVKWVYGCTRLRRLRQKVGKFNRYRESDIIEFENARKKGTGLPLDAKNPYTTPPRSVGIHHKPTLKIAIK